MNINLDSVCRVCHVTFSLIEFDEENVIKLTNDLNLRSQTIKALYTILYYLVCCMDQYKFVEIESILVSCVAN